MSDPSPVVAAAEPEFAAFVAIDWADQKHYWRLVAAGSQKQEQGVLDHTPEAVAAWAAELAVRFGGQPIAVCLEQRRGALVSMLSTYGHLVLFPVHPRMIASFRTAFYPSGSKSDPSDTDLLLMVLLRHRERLRPLKPDDRQPEAVLSADPGMVRGTQRADSGRSAGTLADPGGAKTLP
jgi:hypothetical protein